MDDTHLSVSFVAGLYEGCLETTMHINQVFVQIQCRYRLRALVGLPLWQALLHTATMPRMIQYLLHVFHLKWNKNPGQLVDTNTSLLQVRQHRKEMRPSPMSSSPQNGGHLTHAVSDLQYIVRVDLFAYEQSDGACRISFAGRTFQMEYSVTVTRQQELQCLLNVSPQTLSNTRRLLSGAWRQSVIENFNLKQGMMDWAYPKMVPNPSQLGFFCGWLMDAAGTSP
jgi:hypothetical protein